MKMKRRTRALLAALFLTAALAVSAAAYWVQKLEADVSVTIQTPVTVTVTREKPTS
ncbi:MAG: hypothetical protein GXW99_03135 [Clostridiales bacterium]|nr:hypothetical protein [Clostridiales bacterium]